MSLDNDIPAVAAQKNDALALKDCEEKGFFIFDGEVYIEQKPMMKRLRISTSTIYRYGRDLHLGRRSSFPTYYYFGGFRGYKVSEINKWLKDNCEIPPKDTEHESPSTE